MSIYPSEVSGDEAALDTALVGLIGPQSLDSMRGPQSRASKLDERALEKAHSNTRDVAPPMARIVSTKAEAGAATGNFVITYFNVGEPADGSPLEEHHIDWIRRNPGQILVASEVSKSMEAGLQRPTVEGRKAEDTDDGIEVKTRYKYITLRMELDKVATMIAVRERSALAITKVWAENRLHGLYTLKKVRRESRSKILVAKIELARPVAFFQKDLIVMGLHWHNMCAKKASGLSKAHDDFLAYLSNKIVELKVDVLCTDANMGMLALFSRLRSRGVCVDVGAWFPWQLQTGERAMDSCTIIFINKPGNYDLDKSLSSLHGDDRSGLFCTDQPIVDLHATNELRARLPVLHGRANSDTIAGNVYQGGFAVIQNLTYGFGKPYSCYLPKKPWDFSEALADFLTRSTSVEQQDEIARSSGRDRISRWGDKANSELHKAYKRDRLHMKEIRLDKAMFLFEAEWPKGAHFPLCAATRNNSDRTPEAKARRQGNKERNRLARTDSGPRTSVVTDVRAVRSHRASSATRSSVGAASSRGQFGIYVSQALEPQAASSSSAAWENWAGVQPHAAPSSRGSWDTSRQWPAARSSSQSGPQSRYRQPTSGRQTGEIQQTNPPLDTVVRHNSRGTYVPPERDPYRAWPHWAQQ